MGLVFVLLLGEIDLSAGYTGGTAAAVTGVVMTKHGWPWIPSLLACLLDRRGDRHGASACWSPGSASRRSS